MQSLEANNNHSAAPLDADSAYPNTPEVLATEDDPEDLVPYLLEMVRVEERRADFLMHVIIPLGAALVGETDFNHLLERILCSAISMSRADGGVLYLINDQRAMRVALLRREALGIALGGTGGALPELTAMHLSAADADDASLPIAARAALRGEMVSEYHEDSAAPHLAGAAGAQTLDQEIDYHVRSALAVPLRDPAGSVSGVIELSNARRENSHRPVPFESAIARAVEAMSVLAAAALQSYLQQEKLKDQVRALRVQIDNTKKQRQVEAITGSDYFKSLKARARELRGAIAAPDGDQSPAILANPAVPVDASLNRDF